MQSRIDTFPVASHHLRFAEGDMGTNYSVLEVWDGKAVIQRYDLDHGPHSMLGIVVISDHLANTYQLQTDVDGTGKHATEFHLHNDRFYFPEDRRLLAIGDVAAVNEPLKVFFHMNSGTIYMRFEMRKDLQGLMRPVLEVRSAAVNVARD